MALSEKVVIMMSASHDIDPVRHQQQYVLNKNYALAVTAAGGIPVLAVDGDSRDELVRMSDGLVLTGGWPLHPDNLSSGYYTGKDQQTYTNEVRVPYDIGLYNAFREAGKPVMGICQGLLMMNIAQGGTNRYDLPGELGLEHGEGITHGVIAEEDSIVGSLFGQTFPVNSHHTHYIAELGADLRITARSPDGIIEAIEHTQLPIFAIQWHPERMRGEMPNPPKGPDMTKLFRYFIDSCRPVNKEREGGA